MPSDAEEMAASFAAVRTFALYNQLGLFFALVEKNVIDAERVFAFNRMSTEILRTTAAKTDNEVAKRGCNGAAEMLDEFEKIVRNMVTKPPGAGTA